MSRTINESVNQLKSSLSDIKTSLTNKNVEGGEQLKVSEIAGLIDQIEAGSSGGFNWLENVTLNDNPLNGSCYEIQVDLDGDGKTVFTGTFKFTPKEDEVQMSSYNSGGSITIEPKIELDIAGRPLTKGTEYTLSFTKSLDFIITFFKGSIYQKQNDKVDIFAYKTN